MDKEIKVIALLVTKGTKDLSCALSSINKQKEKVDEIIISKEKGSTLDSTFTNNFRKGLASNTQQALLKLYFSYDLNKYNILVATIDDDDEWGDEWIAFAKEKYKEGYNSISCSMNVYDGGKNLIEQRITNKKPNAKDYILGNDGVQGSNKAFDLRIALESGGMHKEVNASTDRILNHNILSHPEVRYITTERTLVNYTFDKNNKSITNDPNRIKELEEFYKVYGNKLTEEDIERINTRHLTLHGFKDVIKWK